MTPNPSGECRFCGKAECSIPGTKFHLCCGDCSHGENPLPPEDHKMTEPEKKTYIFDEIGFWPHENKEDQKEVEEIELQGDEFRKPTRVGYVSASNQEVIEALIKERQRAEKAEAELKEIELVSDSRWNELQELKIMIQPFTNLFVVPEVTDSVDAIRILIKKSNERAELAEKRVKELEEALLYPEDQLRFSRFEKIQIIKKLQTLCDKMGEALNPFAELADPNACVPNDPQYFMMSWYERAKKALTEHEAFKKENP